MSDYQLIIIGAGPGGYEAAIQARELGLKTAMIEKRDVGGTCLNRGCIPTKTLLHVSDIWKMAAEAEEYGLQISNGTIDIGAVFRRKEEVSTQLRDGLTEMLEGVGVDILPGTGTITGSHEVRISGPDGTKTIRSDALLIATGSKPAMPPIPGLDLEGVMTSDQLLEGSDTIFRSMIIIGGGVIGVELAEFYSRIGTDVTILEGMDRLLPNMDKELGQSLARILKSQKVTVCTKAMVKNIAQSEAGLTVTYENKEIEKVITAEKVLCAVGRIPETDQLFGEGITVEMDRRRIRVNSSYETSIPGIYAIGDVSSKIQLAHAAAAQGRKSVDIIAGKKPSEQVEIIPGCVFTDPEIAYVGMTEEEAKAAGIAAICGKSVLFSNGRTVIQRAPRSFMKVVSDRESHRILGAQLMCEHASDMISEITEALAMGNTVEDLLTVVRPHPTFEEGLTGALKAAKAKLV